MARRTTVLFLAPEHPAPHRDYVRSLQAVGARVHGIGHQAPGALDAELKSWLDGYEAVGSVFDQAQLSAAAHRLGKRHAADRVEAVDEMLTLSAARLRGALGLPGLPEAQALLCRDKTAMKEALRQGGIACAASAAVSSEAEAFAFAEANGYPLILKPRAGLGAQQTFRVSRGPELAAAVKALGVRPGQSAAIEEFIEGHEGFYDTLTVAGQVRHDFIAHYYPNVLEAMGDRRISPQIVSTNRLDAGGYGELIAMGRKVIELLGIETSATHMEWFFGPKGLKFSEIGARPPGERLWDLHCATSDIDLYREWALAVTGKRSEQQASRRFAAGTVQVRPPCDGVVAGYRGLDRVWKACGEAIFASGVPRPGTPTRPIRLGYLENTWFRLRHPDYDQLRGLLDFIGKTVKVLARPA
jgi:hypothetical protein